MDVNQPVLPLSATHFVLDTPVMTPLTTFVFENAVNYSKQKKEERNVHNMQVLNGLIHNH